MALVKRLLEDEANQAGLILKHAFFNDPLAVYMLPQDDGRDRLLSWHFAALARYGAMFGEAYTDPRCQQGVAVWLPPGATDMTDDRVAMAGMDQAPTVLGEDVFQRFMTVMEYMEAIRAEDMPDKHWYLAVIGVVPEAVGQGLGGGLLRPVLNKADSQGIPCYLETVEANNQFFYEKYGFKVVRQGVEPSSGLDYWTFRRDPR